MQRRDLLGFAVAAALGFASRAWSAESTQSIRTRGYLKIGTSGTAPPNTWVNARDELTGYDIDWGNLIGRKLGLPVEWVREEFIGLLPALAAGQLDLVMSGVRIRPQLQQVFLFSRPYSYERMAAVVRARDTGMRNFADFAGRTVAVVASSFQEDAVKNIGGYRELLSLPSGSDVFLCLHTKHADVAIVGLTAALHYIRAGHAGLRVIAAEGELNPQGIVMQQGSYELKQVIDGIIAAAIADGTYRKLYLANFGIEPLK